MPQPTLTSILSESAHCILHKLLKQYWKFAVCDLAPSRGAELLYMNKNHKHLIKAIILGLLAVKKKVIFTSKHLFRWVHLAQMWLCSFSMNHNCHCSKERRQKLRLHLSNCRSSYIKHRWSFSLEEMWTAKIVSVWTEELSLDKFAKLKSASDWGVFLMKTVQIMCLRGNIFFSHLLAFLFCFR